MPPIAQTLRLHPSSCSQTQEETFTTVFLVPGEDSSSIEFASNRGAAIAEGQFQPGDLVRVSAMSCQHSAVRFAAYNKHFVEGMAQPSIVLVSQLMQNA